MESFFIYLVKCSSILCIFYFAYLLFLKKETFFNGNRFYLVGGIIAALTLPFLVFTTVEWINLREVEHFNATAVTSGTAQLATTDIPIETNNIFVNFWELLGIVYVLGTVFFFVRFCIQLASLYSLFKRSNVTKENNLCFVRTKDKTTPFSFFNCIVFNPAMHHQKELDVILSHEKVHSRQWHSIDIVLGHIIGIILWWNPLVWLYKKSISQNLEFIADNTTVIETQSIKNYQYLLLKAATQRHSYASITNHFFNSLIKKRIVMLNQHPSKKSHTWKYALVLPFIIAFMMSFNTQTVYKIKKEGISENQELSSAQKESDVTEHSIVEPEVTQTNSKVSTQNEMEEVLESYVSEDAAFVNSSHEAYHEDVANEVLHSNNKTIEFIITKNTSAEELKEIIAKAKQEGFDLKFKKIKRNKAGEIISISISMSSEKGNTNYAYNATDPIKAITIYSKEDGSFGYSTDDRNLSEVVVEKHKRGKVKHKKHSHGKNKRKVKEQIIIKGTVEEGEVIEEREDLEEKEEIIIREVIEEREEQAEVNIGQVVVEEIEEEAGPELVKVVKKVKNAKGKANNNVKVEVIEVDGNYKGKNKLDLDVFSGKDGKVKLNDSGKKNYLIFLDGKEISKAELEKVNIEDVLNVDVQKGGDVIKKYGEKAKDGVIKITTKN